MKLIRIINGLYRNESGSIAVAVQLGWRDKDKWWAVRYTNWYGCPITKEFPTLKAARDWLRDERN